MIMGLLQRSPIHATLSYHRAMGMNWRCLTQIEIYLLKAWRGLRSFFGWPWVWEIPSKDRSTCTGSYTPFRLDNHSIYSIEDSRHQFQRGRFSLLEILQAQRIRTSRSDFFWSIGSQSWLVKPERQLSLRTSSWWTKSFRSFYQLLSRYISLWWL